MGSLKSIKTEVDASYLYQQLAGHEEDATLAHVYREMSAIEKSHVEVFAKKQNLPLALY
jgi:vacuolar iron transporter family protein